MRLTHIECRIAQQLSLSEIISNYYDNLIRSGLSNITPVRIHTRIAALKEDWEKFNIIHEAIGIAVTALDEDDKSKILTHDYFINNTFALTHELYIESLEKMISLNETDRTELSQNAQSVTSLSLPPSSSSLPTFFHHARLPRIDIPKFDGSPSDWFSFKDLFRSLVISNPTLSAVEKLQYLKTSLIGSAAHLIKNTSLTADNFEKAWEALIGFYENKRLLINAALHSLLTLKRMTRESASEMETLYTNIMQIYRTLETLQRLVTHWDDFFVFVAVQRLDSDTVKAWKQHVGPSKEPQTWTNFSEFLVSRLLSLQAYEKSRLGKPIMQNHQRTVKSHYQGKSANAESGDVISCSICSSNHRTAKCPSYQRKTVQQKRDIIIKHKLCFNCLKPHRSSACRSTHRCIKCTRKHHTSIHEDNFHTEKSKTNNLKGNEVASSNSTKISDAHVLHSSLHRTAQVSCVSLATAQVLIVSPNGGSSNARVLIDQGSEISLISERLVQRLRLSRNKSNIQLIGIGGYKSNSTNGVTSFGLKSINRDNFECTITAHILPKLTSSIPSIQIGNQSWTHLKGLTLADPEFLTRGSIDLILGADVYNQIIDNGLKGPEGTPIA